MENKLNEVPLANLNNENLDKIKKLEEELENNYYLIAFKRK